METFAFEGKGGHVMRFVGEQVAHTAAVTVYYTAADRYVVVARTAEGERDLYDVRAIDDVDNVLRALHTDLCNTDTLLWLQRQISRYTLRKGAE